MKLIDKDALVAEIENIRKHYIERDDFDNGWNFALNKILSFLDTFEVKEVDLEKEIEEYAYSLPHGTTGSCSYVSDKRLPIARQFGIKHNWDYEKVENIARHFFELGIKAQKGENV